MIDDKFLLKVAPLQVSEMGTECVAPLLYWLIRMLRPNTVLEVGAGYTTPFLAKAIRDNWEASEVERQQLPRLAYEPPFLLPEYYVTATPPKLVCVDRLTDNVSSAAKVLDVLSDLDLSSWCYLVKGDLRDVAESVVKHVGSIDFAWVDTWDTLAFLRLYWNLINPAGGILAVHWLLTYPQGRAVLRYIESLRAVEDGALEILSVLEPHKGAQNSLTLIRRVREYEDPYDLRPHGSESDPLSSLHL